MLKSGLWVITGEGSASAPEAHLMFSLCVTWFQIFSIIPPSASSAGDGDVKRGKCAEVLCRNWDTNALMSWNKNIFLEKEASGQSNTDVSACGGGWVAAVIVVVQQFCEMWARKWMKIRAMKSKCVCVGQKNSRKVISFLLLSPQSSTVNPFKLFTTPEQ